MNAIPEENAGRTPLLCILHGEHQTASYTIPCKTEGSYRNCTTVVFSDSFKEQKAPMKPDFIHPTFMEQLGFVSQLQHP